MSSSPKPSDAVAADPLAEALDRLEHSMSGNLASSPLAKAPSVAKPAPAVRSPKPAGAETLPAPRREGQTPKSMVPEGMRSAVAEPPTAAPVAREAAPEQAVAPPRQQRPRPQPAPAVDARTQQRSEAKPTPRRTQQRAVPAPERLPSSNGVAPPLAPPTEVRKTVETWSAPEVVPIPKTEPASRRETASLQREISRARPQARPEAPAQAPAPVVEIDDEIREINPGIEQVPEAVPTARRTGNRRVAGGGGSVWGAVILASLIQFAILAGLAVMLWPGIKEGILVEAGAAAQGGEVASRALNARIEQSEQRLGTFAGELESMRQQMSVAPGDAWKELDFLQARNRLLEFGDRAINQADREAYDELSVLAEKGEDQRLRDGASSELLRVRFAYSIGIRAASHTIPVGQLFPSLRDKRETDLGTEQLVKVLLDSTVKVQYRTKAAYLLADRRSGRAADALASAILTDKSLDVVREASMTFSEMTGYRTDDLFDAERLGVWWKANEARVKAVLGS